MENGSGGFFGGRLIFMGYNNHLMDHKRRRYGFQRR